VVACGETVTQVGEADVVALRVTPDSGRVARGSTLQIRAFPLDESSAFLPSVAVVWSSSNSSIATVDDNGIASGVTLGSAEITATAAGMTATSVVTVETPPVIVPATDSVAFSMVAGGADPAPDSIDITNGGAFPLSGMTVASVSYSTALEGWLMAQLTATAPPTQLVLTPVPGGETTAGVHVASVRLAGSEADTVTVPVVLEIEPGPPAAVEVSAGASQTAVAGSNVPVAPAVLVTDAFDNPVPSVQVLFSVTDGGGSITGATTATGADGVATVGSWTLGAVAGANELTATPTGLTGVTISATGVPGAAAALEINAGDGQSAVAGAAVAVPPSVIVRDALGNGVPDIDVTFAVASGGGSISGAAQTTDANGVAAVGSWTLGTTAGTNTLEVTSGAVSGTVTITATGISGAAVAIQLEGGDAQTDTVAATLAPYQVKVVDVNGNGVAGVTVSWGVTGGGGSIPSTSVTDANGVAAAARVLSQTVGVHLAEGGVGGLQNSPIQFTATALPGNPAALVDVEGGGQTATVGTAVTTDPRVRLEDQFGNAIAGASVDFTVTAGGGSVVPDAVSTDASGESAVTSWTLGTVSGTNNNTLQAVATGTGVAAVNFTASGSPDAPASITGGTAYGEVETGQAVSGAPTVTVEDQYGNAVPGVTVNFTGDGSIGADPTTNASGVAVTTWSVDAADGLIQDDGTFPNALTATVSGTALSTVFTADVIYSWEVDVYPLFGANGCTAAGCHDVTEFRDLRLDGGAAAAYDEIVGVTPVCDAFSGPVFRVSAASGVDAADVNSLLMLYVDSSLNGIPAGDADGCTGGFMTFDAALDRLILRAWIRNGAPEN
jgi:adhesin/invasin